jgi:hypothetical protein
MKPAWLTAPVSRSTVVNRAGGGSIDVIHGRIKAFEKGFFWSMFFSKESA